MRAGASPRQRLTQLALDMNAPFSQAASRLWCQLNSELWRRTRNAWAVLQTISDSRLEECLKNASFHSALEDATRAASECERTARSFDRAFLKSNLTSVAYFSMEFMLNEALPIYSGGLGNVAGDQLKAASDLAVPVTGIGLLYSQGYFRQELDRDGSQLAMFPFNDPGQLPIQPVRTANGEWLRFTISFPGCDLWIRAWEAKVGELRLLLLDTNDLANFPEYRCITTELYGGGPELRLRQEHVLGIGGWRLLRALGIHPEVCHLNEGHAAFAILERAASFMEDMEQPFGAALTATRAGNLFTTHTPVEAGFDRFAPDLMRAHFEGYCANRLGIGFENLMAMGRGDPHDAREAFNMAYLAARGSGAVNGVSRLHGEVSKTLFQPLFPRWPTPEVPVGHVTNGVHVPTWVCDEATEFWSKRFVSRCWSENVQHVEKMAGGVDDRDLWNLRNAARTSMIEKIRHRYARQIAMQGGSKEEIKAAAGVFKGDVLTLAFARRFATYKRPDLLLQDRDRLSRILRNTEHRVQLVVAGKAHPQDVEGQTLIREWTRFIREFRLPAIFLTDYDMGLTQELAGGIDLWLNTPRRPWEASGTSGMKVLINGGLNLSTLDGWWAEAFAPEVGWALGDGKEHDASADSADAHQLYEILEEQVVPEFYDRDEAGIPWRWMARVRESIARLTSTYSANRVVHEYTRQYYAPAAKAFTERSRDHAALARDIFNWERALQRSWGRIRFGSMQAHSVNGLLSFRIHVDLAGLTADAICVELFANDVSPIEMKSSADGIYTAEIESGRNIGDFTARIIPRHPSASIPLEANQILWQR